MATLNLYDWRTVAATMLYAIQTGNTEVAHAAASELIMSELSHVAEHVATLALFLAPPRYAYVPTEQHKEQRVAAALSLPPFELPTPLPTPIPPRLESQPVVWNPHIKIKNSATVWRGIRDALRNGRIARAAKLSLIVDDEDIPSLLESLGFVPRPVAKPRDRFFVHVFTTGLPLFEMPFPSLQVTCRSFQIDPAALSCWNIPSPPISQLMGAPVWVTGADAAPVWKKAVDRYGLVGNSTYMEGRDDDATEAFYTEFFPKDIPDEWSSKERAKSHGLCVTPYKPNPWISFLV